MTLDELDRLAAEKVVGIKLIKTDFGPEKYWIENSSIAWQPTHNISQAWECLDKLNPKYFDVSKTEYAGYPLYVVSVAGTSVGSYDTKATDKNVATCIVRACLRAKGIDPTRVTE